MYWLLKPDVATGLQMALKRERTSALLADAAAWLAARWAPARAVAGGSVTAGPSTPECLTIAGDVAQITIEGILTEKPDFWAWLFFGANTSYEEIREALALAASNPAVKRVELVVASPGGEVAGLFALLEVLEVYEKPLSVRSSFACSAAYAIAAVAGSITATNAAAMFGSVGVVQSFYVSEAVVDITSTEAPEKRPDVTTDEGKAVVRKQLDAIHDLFVDAIAKGREVTKDAVNAEFGRGSVLLAGEAKRRGMIDKVSKPAQRTNATKAAAEDGESHEETQPMDIKTLKAQHPDLFDAVLAVGRDAERDRVVGHLTLAEASGDMKTAIDSIKSGEGMTATVHAKHVAAGIRRGAQSDRQTDSATAGAAVDGSGGAAPAPAAAAGGATPPEAAGDLGDQVVARLEAKLGKKPLASGAPAAAPVAPAS